MIQQKKNFGLSILQSTAPSYSSAGQERMLGPILQNHLSAENFSHKFSA
jgi:hypothetical protein